MFVRPEETQQQCYDVFDCCYGTVEACYRRGVYLILDNGELAFSFQCRNLWPGTVVLCTVRKMEYGDYRKLVSIDSVCRYPSAA